MWQQLQKKYLGSNIPLINVHGVINGARAQQITARLKTINPTRAVALAVSVNSSGGSPVQGLIISNKIQQYAKKHNLKVFTFARNMATSSGYYVLSHGDYVCADSSSVVGGIGVSISKWQMKGLLETASVQNKHLETSENSLRNFWDPFLETTEAHKKKVEQVCDYTQEKMMERIMKNRGSRLIEDEGVLGGQIYYGQQAREKGLVDEVGSMVQILEKYYPGSHLQIKMKSLGVFSWGKY